MGVGKISVTLLALIYVKISST